jgi:hypothetical protein
MNLVLFRVQITVNRNGNVIAAKHTKGTTNTNPCLVEPALATARKYKMALIRMPLKPK